MTKAQDRARERRRYERQLAREQERRAREQRNKQVLGVVLAVVAVVAAFVFIATRLGKDEPAARSASPTTTQTAANEPTVAPLDGCTAPPALQSAPKQFTKVPDKAAAAGKVFDATITTNCGPVVVELDGRKAPQTVASFLNLAKAGYWAPSPCHRLVTSGINVLQCGDPGGTGTGDPGYTFGIENAPADNSYPTGTLAMARLGEDANSNGGQFFIVYKDSTIPSDGAGGYSIFGKVTKGMDIIDRIAAAGDTEQVPNAPISILSIAVTEKKA